MRSRLSSSLAAALILAPTAAFAWNSKPVPTDAMIRQPGTQPSQMVLTENSTSCVNCHAGYDANTEPMFAWQGSLMAHSAQDFFFWAGMTVAAQDSIWLAGRPNATDQCERCHLPKGWLEGRSEPTNGSSFTGADYDGVQCDFCHRMVDPQFAATHAGLRESSDDLNYWDETNLDPSSPSQPAADACYAEDLAESVNYTLFNGGHVYDAGGALLESGYSEAANGQYYTSPQTAKRGPYADATPPHDKQYSRFHKSKYYCATCHDVSNAHLANFGVKEIAPGDGTTVLPTESENASSYAPVERTFSEFMLSDYGQDGGAPGIGPFAALTTTHAGNVIATCQDCHMQSVVGQVANKNVKERPTGSVEHPRSGDSVHTLAGGNAFIPWVLASSVAGSPNFDAANQTLLTQGANKLTLNFNYGMPLDPTTLLAGYNRAIAELALAASISNVSYDPTTGAASFRVQNNTGHKLLSGYPEGRRMFVNVKVLKAGALVQEINPYDPTAATLKGLPPAYSPNSPALAADELYVDDLVYEAHATSTYTGEAETFHFTLTTGMWKDNRIPPKGFRVAEAGARGALPATNGADDPGRFTAAEYAGGYNDVATTLVTGADAIEVALYYQTVSREYAEFLRDEIEGNADSLSSPTPSGEANAYIAQSDPFFQSLAAWGTTVWQLWDHNKSVPGAAPILMTQAAYAVAGACTGQPDGSLCDDADFCTTNDVCTASVCGGTAVSCDDANPCTDDACDPNAGCSHLFNEARCDSGDPCTANDVCAFGVCTPGGKASCDDGDNCTVDSCDPQMGCQHMTVPNCGVAVGGAGGVGGAPSTIGSGGGAGGANANGGATTSGAPAAANADDGGCGCNLPSEGDDRSPLLAALALLGLVAVRRKSRG